MDRVGESLESRHEDGRAFGADSPEHDQDPLGILHGEAVESDRRTLPGAIATYFDPARSVDGHGSYPRIGWKLRIRVLHPDEDELCAFALGLGSPRTIRRKGHPHDAGNRRAGRYRRTHAGLAIPHRRARLRPGLE